ncbi:ABC transporter ATP-binding protein, partial [Campylobacter jejuni]|nr:ABC transporter ATP-binding protein [Campylobacter jejuni]
MPNLIQANKLTLGYDELVIKEASFAFKDDDF